MIDIVLINSSPNRDKLVNLLSKEINPVVRYQNNNK